MCMAQILNYIILLLKIHMVNLDPSKLKHFFVEIQFNYVDQNEFKNSEDNVPDSFCVQFVIIKLKV